MPVKEEKESEVEALKPVKITLPSGAGGHLSPTQAVMYLRCAKQYEFRYVLGIKEPPAVTLVEGSCHHTALQHNNEHKKKKGTDLAPKKIIERFADAFSDGKKEIEDWKDESEDSVMRRGKLLLPEYLTEFAPKLQPEFIEHEYRFNIGGVEVLGYMDVGGVITIGKQKFVAAVDYKITSRAKSEGEVENSIQLSHYGWGLKDDKKLDITRHKLLVGFCCLTKTKEPKVVWQPSILTAGRLQWYRTVMKSVATSITRGAFPVCDASSNYLCNSRFCGYWSRCKGKVWK